MTMEQQQQQQQQHSAHGRSAIILCIILLLVQPVKCLAAMPTPSSSSSSSADWKTPLPCTTKVISIRTQQQGGDKTDACTTFLWENGTSSSTLPSSNSTTTTTRSRLWFRAAARRLFLPAAYPLSTPDKYLQFCFYSLLQDASTQVRSILATQRILAAVGVGNAAATATAAVANFLVRDGAGLLATLGFTAAATGPVLSNSVKQWRFRADVLVDIGITLEILAAAVPAAYFLPLLCAGNMCKAICGVAAGACNSAIHVYWAGDDTSQLTDIVAKFHAQHTVTSGMALLGAAVVTNILAKRPASSSSSSSLRGLWFGYAFLTLIHLAANVLCMRSIQFNHFNTRRLRLVLDTYFAENTVLNPTQVAHREPLLFDFPLRRRAQPRVDFGVSFTEWMQNKPAATQKHVMESVKSQAGQPYWVLSSADTEKSTSSKSPTTTAVALQQKSSRVEQLQAYFQAYAKARQSSTMDDWTRFRKECEDSGWQLSKTDLTTAGYEVRVE